MINHVVFGHQPGPEVTASGSQNTAKTVLQTHATAGFQGPDQNSLYTVQMFRELTVVCYLAVLCHLEEQ